MAKLIKDKYYTPIQLAKYCIDKTDEIIGSNNITEYLEPSAGNGAFSLQLDNCIAYDLYPEHDSIIQQDFLQLKVLYKKGRCIIGNPPFGARTLYYNFCKKSFSLGDYVAFILPISQWKNSNLIYQFDLIHSENLSNIEFSGSHKIPVCFNIYRRPLRGGENIKTKKVNKYIEYIKTSGARYRSNLKIEDIENCDLILLGWGHKVGRRLLTPFQYANEVYIQLNQDLTTDVKQRVIDVLTNVNWVDEYCDKRVTLTISRLIDYLNRPEVMRKIDNG